MVRCERCNEYDTISKAGILRNKQRYHCGRCDYYFTIRSAIPASPAIKHHPTTILDIARELRISKSTVSRALHSHSDINEETRRAVLKMAEEMDYQPNLLAYGLAKKKSMTIGIIVPEFVNSFFPYIIMGAQEIANPAGYHVVICQSNESLETEIANTNVLMSSRVDGLIASVTRETTSLDHFRKFERAGIPVVMFNRICDGLDVSKVLVDDYEGAYKGVAHLIENGCRRIAHLAGPQNLQIGRQRLRGYVDALQEHGLQVDPDLIIEYNLTKENARLCARQLLDLPHPPDSIFAVNDPAAIETMLIAKSKGIKIPDELAIVGFSNEPTSAIIEPGLTTLAQPLDKIGKTSVEILLKEIENKPDILSPETIILKTDLIIRGSSMRHRREN